LKILEDSTSAADAVHHSNSPVKKSTAIELENSVSVPVVQSTQRRRFACFLRTKSDGAIAGSGSNLHQLISAAYVSNQPLAVVPKAVSGARQVDNKTKSEQGVSDVSLKRRHFKHVHSNSIQGSALMQDSVYSKVVAKSVPGEYGCSVESSNSEQKVPKPSTINDHNLSAKSPIALQSLAKSSDNFQPMSKIYCNSSRVFAGSVEKTSVASAAIMQGMPVEGESNVLNAREITCYSAVPLSTSNIVNISLPCSVAGTHRRVIVIKRRQNLPST